MKEILTQYSLSEVLLLLVLVAIAVKEFFGYKDWFVERLGKFFHKETSQQEKERATKERLERFEKKLDDIQEKIDELSETVTILSDSDKIDIKSYITEKHHFFCYTQKWIDDYSLDCCERRYAIYVQEHGNSYVQQLMEDLRALPKKPPTE